MATPKIIRVQDSLPESLIQHIQSFLSTKQAARTSVVSNSWYKAWLTRPNLDFHRRDFREVDDFWNAVKEAVQMHQDLSLKIESFKLFGLVLSDLESILAELLGKVLKMRVRDISVYCHCSSNHNDFVIPCEVLETESLDRLSLTMGGSKIDLLPSGSLICSKVKSLHLDGLILGDLFSQNFPFLEDLTLVRFIRLKSLNYPSVKSLTLDHVSIEAGFSCLLPCLENLSIKGFNVLGSVNCSSVKSLRLSGICLWENVSWGAFPCLEDLTLESCMLSGVLQISSLTLKCLSLIELNNLRVKFDVPSIRKLKLSGFYSPSKLPSLSFTVVSQEWESDISLQIGIGHTKDPWCFHLRRFMRKFSKSKVSLSFTKFYFGSCMYEEKLKGRCGFRPVVDNLTLLGLSSSCASSDFLNGLLWSCCPKLITVYWFPQSSRSSDKASNEFIKILCKELIQVREESCTRSQMLHVNQDIRDVNVETFVTNLAEWQPISWKTLINASEGQQVKQKLRFQLEWHGTVRGKW